MDTLLTYGENALNSARHSRAALSVASYAVDPRTPPAVGAGFSIVKPLRHNACESTASIRVDSNLNRLTAYAAVFYQGNRRRRFIKGAVCLLAAVGTRKLDALFQRGMPARLTGAPKPARTIAVNRPHRG